MLESDPDDVEDDSPACPYEESARRRRRIRNGWVVAFTLAAGLLDAGAVLEAFRHHWWLVGLLAV